MRRLLLVTLLSGIAAAAIACTSFTSESDPGAEIDGGPEATTAETSTPVEPDAAIPRDGDAEPTASRGCADQSVEAFEGRRDIAGCEGAWDQPGIAAGTNPKCARNSGNSSTNPTGAGCGAEDLCAAGWHVCKGLTDVGNSKGAAPGGICAARGGGAGLTFYATAQPSDGVAQCPLGSSGVDDVFGCGDIATQPSSSCSPLNAVIGTNQPLDGFHFGTNDKTERADVTKTVGPGGVLCCRD